MPTQEVHRRLFASGFDQNCDRGRYTLEQQCAEICARLRVTWDVPHVAKLWAHVFEPDPDVLAAIDHAHKLAGTALLSNNGPLVHLVVRQVFPEVAARFDHLCFSYQVGALKPEAGAFLATLERLGLRLEECVFVDDSAENVEGARAVGLDAFCFVSANDLMRQFRQRGLT